MTGGCNGQAKSICYERFEGDIKNAHDIWARWASLVMLFLTLLPSVALASPSLEVDGNWAGYDDGVEYKGYVVVDCSSDYIATLVLIGQYSKLVQIDSDMYAKLSHPNTGGAFYELAQQWEILGTSPDGKTENYPSWLASSRDFANGLNSVYGYGKVWECVASDKEIEDALWDFNAILNGNDVGADDSEPETDGTYVYIDTIPNDIDRPAGYTVVYSGLAIKQADYNKLVAFASNNEDYKLWISIGAYVGGRYSADQPSYSVLLTNSEPIHFVNLDTTEIWGSVQYEVGTKIYGTSCSTNKYGNTIEYNDKTYVIAKNAFTFSINEVTQSYYDVIRPTYSYYWGNINGSSGGSGGDDPSPNPWEPEPDPTPQPDPPKLPDPKDPTIPTPKDPTPQPDPPDLPVPRDPTLPGPPENPTVEPGGDFTVDIQGILDALDEHCQHLQNNLNGNFSGWGSYLGAVINLVGDQISGTIYDGNLDLIAEIDSTTAYITQNVVTALNNLLETLGNNQIAQIQYFEEFATWLDEKLDYQFPEVSEYDDSSVIYWLKRIYYMKDGTGVTTRPVDPVTDPFGIGKWLSDLVNTLINALEGLFPGLLGDAMSLIDLLAGKFPFSLPWDMLTIVSLFAAEPVTPAWDFPCFAYTSQGIQKVSDYHIDLSAYDDIMGGVRFVTMLMFMAFVLGKVPSWVQIMEGVVNGA